MCMVEVILDGWCHELSGRKVSMESNCFGNENTVAGCTLNFLHFTIVRLFLCVGLWDNSFKYVYTVTIHGHIRFGILMC